MLIPVLLSWNLITLSVTGMDKLKAIKKTKRISESTILFIAFAMGSPGVLMGMLIFHHKTQKRLFIISVLLMFVINVLTTAGMIKLFLRL